MQKNIFTYIVVAIQSLLLVCFALVAINNMPRQWKVANDSLSVLNPNNNKGDTVQSTIPIKSFVAKNYFNQNHINDSYITAALENLHVKFVFSQKPDIDMELDVLSSSSNLLYYKVFNQKEILHVAVYCPNGSAPRVAVVNKEQVK